MAWGVSASAFSQPNLAGERRRVNTQNSQSNSGKYIFFFFAVASPPSPVKENFGLEGQVLHFLALDVTIWAPRVWNEGISEVVVGPRSAYSYKCLHQADAQVQPAFDGLVSCRRALETERDSADRFMDLFRAPLQTFQLQMMTTESSVPISELRSPTHATATIVAMPIVPYLWTRRIHVQRRRRNQRKLLAAQTAFKKWQRGCPPLIGAEDGSPSHSATSHYLHRTADAPPDVLNCPTQSSRRAMELICQRRSTVVRRITDIPALGQLHEESKRGRSRDVCAVNVEAENVPSGAIQNLMPHARTADERGELCGFFDGNIRCGAIDPTAVRQDAAVYVGNESDLAGHGNSVVKKIAARSETKQARPLTKEEMNQVIRSRTDWKERVV
ncbi:hypothetical protein TcCL_NonESM10117, partial [Trypanosoma cruzi]